MSNITDIASDVSPAASGVEIPCYTATCTPLPPHGPLPCDGVAKWLTYLGESLPILGCSVCMERWLCWGNVDRVEPLVP